MSNFVPGKCVAQRAIKELPAINRQLPIFNRGMVYSNGFKEQRNLMNVTRSTYFSKQFFLVAAICLMVTSSLHAQVSGIWRMDSGQTFFLNQDGTNVTGVFTGNNFGGTVVFGEAAPDGTVTLFGIGSTGSLYHIDLVLNDDDTLSGSVVKRNFLNRPQRFSFNADKPFIASYSELDGFWELKDIDDERKGSFLTVITYEDSGVRTQLAIELLTRDGVPYGPTNFYTGRAFNREGGFVWVGNAGILSGTYEGESLNAVRLSWFPASANGFEGSLLIKREQE